MGPRFFKRGEISQWLMASRFNSASMGPRFFKRGEDPFASNDLSLSPASMGPRFFKRGEGVLAGGGGGRDVGFNGATLLQAWRETLAR